MVETIVTHSPHETHALGVTWGEQAQAGWIIGLIGDLGAGKTHLVKGLAQGLGITSRVQSPTFTLVHEYAGGRCPLFHLDLYRLENEAAIRSAGLDQYLYQQTGVTVIEWADRWPELDALKQKTKRNYRAVQLEPISEFERRISYEDFDGARVSSPAASR